MKWLKVEIHTFWHAGTGRGDGPAADAVVLRSAEGLPVLPGRTLKGLLRDAAELLEGAGGDGKAGAPAPGRAAQLFGSSSQGEAAHGAARFATEPGLLRFGSAELGRGFEEQAAWRSWAAGEEGRAGLPHLFQTVSSTAIGEGGVIQGGSLRTFEVVVPMTLHAPLEAVADDSAWEADLEAILPLVREVGSKKSRGFGRCTVSMEEVGDA